MKGDGGLTRTPLNKRILPRYTKGEEIFNMTSHIAGGGLGIVMATLCITFSALGGDPWAIVSSSVYGASLVMLYTASSIYHGLRPGIAKKVFQVIDHCTIYFLIAGTYTPVLFCSVRKTSPAWGWTIFGVVWGLAAFAATMTAIDLKKYRILSMICYIVMGWCIVFASKAAIESIPKAGLIWLLAGGVAYTIGAVLYGVGRTVKYMHSVFHLFVIAGSVFQFVCIFFYIII